MGSVVQDLLATVRDTFRIKKGTLDASGLTANRNYTLPDASGTLALGGTASGITTVNFGAFPGASDAKTTIIGQTNILAGSKVNAYLVATGTADHSADEHWVESLQVMAGGIVPGVGFDIYAKNTNQLNEPVSEQWAVTRLAGPGTGINQIRPDINGGGGTRIYGQFTVAWEWS